MDAGPSTPQSSFHNITKDINVLLVDKDKEVLASTARVLEWFSYEVTTVESGLDAISMILDRTKKVDLVITETRLPDIDGFMLLNETNARGIPTVLMSTNEDARVAQTALRNGACLFLTKPPSADVLKILWQHTMKQNLSTPKSIQEKDHGLFINPNEMIAEEMNETETDSSKDEDGKRGSSKEMDEDEELDGSVKRRKTVQGKVYLEWTEELHGKFVAAVRHLGHGKCYPKDILELMDVPGLTRMQVASHLQKCRTGTWRGPETRKANVPERLNNTDGSRVFGSMPQFEIPPSQNLLQTPHQQEDFTALEQCLSLGNNFLPNTEGNDDLNILLDLPSNQNQGHVSSGLSANAPLGDNINASNQNPDTSGIFDFLPELEDPLSFSKLFEGSSILNPSDIQASTHFEVDPLFLNQDQGHEEPKNGNDDTWS